MKAKTLLTMLALCGTLAACSSGPKIRADQDRNANFASYKTYAWLDVKPPEPQNAGIKKLNESAEDRAKKQEADAATHSLLTRRVRSALSRALQTKGLTLDESKPDVRINPVIHVYDRSKQSGFRIGLGVGGGSGNVSGGAGVSLPVGKRTETVAAMTIDVVDVARNAQVWTGSYENVIKEPTATDADVQHLVDTILTKYPTRTN